MPHPEHNSRRRFLQLTAGLGVAGLAGPAAVAASLQPIGSRVGEAALSPGRGRVKNVILFIIDGMDHGTASLADQILRRRDGRRSTYFTLWGDERTVVGRCMTHSRDGLVTDSAAAGSAYGIGEHIDNGSINVVDGREPTPIMVRAREAGLATGLVTTTRITHATPAAMVCNASSRNMEDEIAAQMLDRPVDVMLGGGARHFPDALLGRHSDVRVMRTAGDLQTVPRRGRVLGLFNGSHLSYDLDRPRTEPSLDAMTRFALDRLTGMTDRPGSTHRGFLMQIEAGRVDHAGHANDAAAIVHDQIACDRAMETAVDYVDGRDDTLLIITTDHGCGGPQLSLYGEAGDRAIDQLGRARHTGEWLSGELGGEWAAATAARLREAIGEMTNADIPAERIEWFQHALARLGPEGPAMHGFDPANRANSLLGSMLANIHGVSFASPSHNSTYVDVLARGPSSERIGRFIDNVDLHRLMAEELGLS